MIQFEFEDWANLYKTDPEAFEMRRGAALEAYIQQAPEENRQRLEQTLFRIEMARKTSKSPLQAAINASKLMWESYGKLRDQVEEVAVEVKSYQGSVDQFKTNTLKLVGKENTIQPVLRDATSSPVQRMLVEQTAQVKNRMVKDSATIIPLPHRSQRH